MDFVGDVLGSGRRFRTLNIVDDYTREAVAVEADTSLGGVRVCGVLDRRKIERRGVRVESRKRQRSGVHQPRSGAVGLWAWSGVALERTETNGRERYVESFNGKFSDECLNENWFTTLGRGQAEDRRQDNQARPHSALGYRTPQRIPQRSRRAGVASPTTTVPA